MNANAAQSPALLGRGQLSTDTVQPHRSSLYSHSAHLPALDSDGAAALQVPRRALTASDALRAAGFRKIPALWVQERDLDAIIAFAERYADRVNEIRADVRKEAP